jgi:hypothetical protein
MASILMFIKAVVYFTSAAQRLRSTNGRKARKRGGDADKSTKDEQVAIPKHLQNTGLNC